MDKVSLLMSVPVRCQGGCGRRVNGQSGEQPAGYWFPDGDGLRFAKQHLAVGQKGRCSSTKSKRNCFILALHLNPNDFEAILSLSGIVQDTDTALQCLSRGYRLRPQDPNIVPAIHILCESRSLPLETTARRIEQLAAEMDVTRPLPQFMIDDPCPYLRHLGLENEIQV